MTFFIFLIIIVLLVRLLMPYLRAWALRRMQRKAEDYFYRATGFPPPSRDEEKKNRRRQSSRSTGSERYDDPRRYTSSPTPVTDVADEMKRVAEDVDFVEIHDYSETVEIKKDKDVTSVRVEEQVTDADYVVIKKPIE